MEKTIVSSKYMRSGNGKNHSFHEDACEQLAEVIDKKTNKFIRRWNSVRRLLSGSITVL